MTEDRIRAVLSQIYGPEVGASTAGQLGLLLDKYRRNIPAPRALGWSERDCILITYPDQVQEAGRHPLAVLGEFCSRHLSGLASGIHILPFYPWSSDDGFSVIDYQAVDPRYGQWSDVRQIGEKFRLMFDAVINHASAQSAWFKGFLKGDAAYRDYFIEVDVDADLTKVVRPRALPLLTQFQSQQGTRNIWTTFSADQVDLNYHNPAVLLRVLDALLFYAQQGVSFIRLDAIAYLWKEPGTSCINLPQTHSIVKLMRAVLDEVAPYVQLITETNVPNLENLSYFGDGRDEAQLVYNFPLPPLVLHAMQTGNASVLSHWAATLELPSEHVTFLNFLASHDGIGLNPARGILPEKEIGEMACRAEAAGGFVSNKTNPDGSQSPYELNVNYFDALDAGPSAQPDLQVRRFVTAHAILLAFRGLPAVYFHSLFGSRGWLQGVKETGRYRTINRQKLDRAQLEAELAQGDSARSQVFRSLSHLLRVRSANSCFSPHASQRVLVGTGRAFALLRFVPETGQQVLCIHSVSPRNESISLDLAHTALSASSQLHDLVTGRQVNVTQALSLTMAPYETLWLTS